jgi:hypothetical protein
VLLLSLSQFVIAANAAGAEQEYREVTIADPFIELHTGPGRGYPVFFVAERGERITLLKRRTDWFKVEVARGQEGWVHFEQLATTLDLDGDVFDLPALGFGDYSARRWEVGALYGDFGGANVIAAYGSRSFTPNLSAELSPIAPSPRSTSFISCIPTGAHHRISRLAPVSSTRSRRRRWLRRPIGRTRSRRWAPERVCISLADSCSAPNTKRMSCSRAATTTRK